MGPTSHQLLVEMLQDAYEAEHQLIAALSTLIRTTEPDDIRKAFESHLTEAKAHTSKLERFFEDLDKKMKGENLSASQELAPKANNRSRHKIPAPVTGHQTTDKANEYFPL